MKTTIPFIAFLLLTTVIANSQENWINVDQKTGTHNYEDLGEAIAIYDNIAVASSTYYNYDNPNDIVWNNKVIIYKKTTNGNWTVVQEIAQPQFGAEIKFGCSIGLSNEYLIIGAQRDCLDQNSENYQYWAGAVYIYKKSGNGHWDFYQKIVSSDRYSSGFFGNSVSIFNDQIIIGAFNKNQKGAAFSFILDENDNWIEEHIFMPNQNEIQGRFGYSVSISENQIVIGAPNEGYDNNSENYLENAGATYIYEKDISNQWILQTRYVPFDRSEEDWFGNNVSISGGYAIAGSHKNDKDVNGNLTFTDAGASYIIKKTEMEQWEFAQKLTASNLQDSANFGSSNCINGNQIIIGAKRHNQSIYFKDTGAAYFFELNESNVWTETKWIEADFPVMNAEYGQTVCINDKYAIIGSSWLSDNINNLEYCGSIYFFKKHFIGGRTFRDYNSNCTMDNIDFGVNGIFARINPGNILVTTANNGWWFIDSLPPGEYSIAIDTTGNWKTQCGDSQNFTFVDENTTTHCNDFALFNNNPCAYTNVSVFMPFIRHCFSDQMVYIDVANNSNSTASFHNGYVEVSLYPALTLMSANLPYTVLGSNNYRFEVDNIIPGQTFHIILNTNVTCEWNFGPTVCIEAELFPQTTCSIANSELFYISEPNNCSSEYDNSILNLQGECFGDSLSFSITNTGNIGTADMQCYSPVNIYIDGLLYFEDSIRLTGQEVKTYNFDADGRTWRLETKQHPEYPGNKSLVKNIEFCGDQNNWTPNMINVLPSPDLDNFIDIYCGTMTGSYDPNDKTGYPLGVGEEHLIMPNGKIDYVIRFQNTGTDTAFNIVVRDTLSQNLNIFSLQLGVSSHNYSFRMYDQNILEWRFSNIMLPDSTHNETLSHGFLTFSVFQQPNLPDGTTITNSADIYFDFNDPIITNQTTHTIDRNVIKPVYDSVNTITDQVCHLYELNGLTYSESGTYYQITQEAEGSVLNTINIEITNPNLVIETTDSTLVSDASNSTYQWLDCNNGFEIIAGQTSQFFEPTENGTYSLEVTENNCTDTTQCISFNSINLISNEFASEFSYYPNPSNGNIEIEFGKIQPQITIAIKDITGRTIQTEIFKDIGKIPVYLSGKPGVYFILIESLEKSAVIKVVKE